MFQHGSFRLPRSIVSVLILFSPSAICTIHCHYYTQVLIWGCDLSYFSEFAGRDNVGAQSITPQGSFSHDEKVADERVEKM